MGLRDDDENEGSQYSHVLDVDEAALRAILERKLGSRWYEMCLPRPQVLQQVNTPPTVRSRLRLENPVRKVQRVAGVDLEQEEADEEVTLDRGQAEDDDDDDDGEGDGEEEEEDDEGDGGAGDGEGEEDADSGDDGDDDDPDDDAQFFGDESWYKYLTAVQRKCPLV